MLRNSPSSIHLLLLVCRRSKVGIGIHSKQSAGRTNALSTGSITVNRADPFVALALAGGGMRGMWFGVPTKRRPECGTRNEVAQTAQQQRADGAHSQPLFHAATRCVVTRTNTSAPSAHDAITPALRTPRRRRICTLSTVQHRHALTLAPVGTSHAARRQPPHDVDRLFLPFARCIQGRRARGAVVDAKAPALRDDANARCPLALLAAPLPARPSALAVDPTL